jgi:hypothetical protein
LKTTLIVCLLWLCSCFASAQPAPTPAAKQEIIAAYQKVCAWFVNTNSYLFKIRYNSYKDHKSKERVESSEGFYKRVDNNYVTEAAGIKTIQNATLKIMIDRQDKIITLLNPDKLNPTMASAADLEALLDNAKNLKKTKRAGSTTYHIGLKKGRTYDAYEFTVSDKGLLEMVTYYYSEQVEKTDKHENPNAADIKMKPRLDISFFNYETPAPCTELEFSEQGIITRNKGKINLTGSYKDYRLLDYRLQAKK